MKLPAKDLKLGDEIVLMGKKAKITSIELSDIGKHGKRKARIEAVTEKEEKTIIIRPEDYPFEKT